MGKFNVNEEGFFGEFGGAFVPEVLYANVEHLRKTYQEEIAKPDFQKELKQLLRDYVGRPTPLFLAERISQKYGCKVYLKREDLNHTGAHKINNVIGQVLIAKRSGKKRIIAETGAGQHGVATATVCALLGLQCIVYMGEVDVERQFLNVQKMRMLGAEVVPVISGSKTLASAVDEALRDWCSNPADTFYVIGSAVGPHPYPAMVAYFQSVISEEVRKQLLEKENKETPDYVIACIGGGSNAAGAFYHFMDDENVQLILAEAGGKGLDTGEHAASLSLGTDGILHGSLSLLLQDEDGQVIEPYSISAGLDYPGVGPMHANLIKQGRASVFAITDDDAVDAAFELTEMEGIIPAIESAHALAVLGHKKFKPSDIVVISLSGRGDKDMDTYIKIREQKMRG